MKINEVIYNKLVAQADEAQEQGFNKLASDIKLAVSDGSVSEASEYCHAELKDDIDTDLWKVATRIMYYYGIDSVDAQKLDQEIAICTEKVMNILKNAMDVKAIIGVTEPKVFGETK